jgi:hypothetical protein
MALVYKGMIYGGLGRYSLLVLIKIRIRAFWADLHFTSNTEKLSIKIQPTRMKNCKNREAQQVKVWR